MTLLFNFTPLHLKKKQAELLTIDQKFHLFQNFGKIFRKFRLTIVFLRKLS